MTRQSALVPWPRGPVSAANPFVAVVGVDGSTASHDALLWAMRTALENSWELDIVTIWPMHAPVLVHGVPGHFCEPRWIAAHSQATTIAKVLSQLDAAPRYVVRLENGIVRDTLISMAKDANVLVLGTDGPDPHSHDSTGGSVPDGTRLTADVRQAADCPVVLVPHEAIVPVLVSPDGRT